MRTRKILLCNRKARRMWPKDFVNRGIKGFYAYDGSRLRFSKREWIKW